jgi:hypothetical protein
LRQNSPRKQHAVFAASSGEEGDVALMVSLRNMLVKLGFLMISNGFKLPNTTLQLIDSFFYYVYIGKLLKQLKINCIIDVGSNDGSLAKNFRRTGYNGQYNML